MANFFEEPSPLGDRDTRAEAIEDYAGNLDADIEDLLIAVKAGDLTEARQHFESMKQWMDAIDDNICERNADGTRKDGGV